MQKLDSLIGKNILVSVQNSEKAAYEVTLQGTEPGGIWIRSIDLEKLVGFKKTKSSDTPVFFMPFSQIFFLVLASADVKKTLGL
jgi:hypothetical protein